MAVIKKITFSDNSNNLGVNTSTPNATLDVNGNAIITGSLTTTGNASIGGTMTAQAVIYLNSTYKNYYLYNSAGSGVLGLFYNYGANPSIQTWTSDGNSTLTGTFTVSGTGYSSIAGRLGVGTTNPTAKLHLVSNSAYLRATIESESTPQVIISNGTQISYFGINGDLIPCVASQTNDPLAFLTNNTERMRLTGSGSLGVGTTTPYYGIDVYNGHVAFKNATSQTDQGGDAKNIGLGWASSAQQNVLSNLLTVDRVGNYAGDFKFYSRSQGGGVLPAPLMVISGSGNVGIGTNSPNEKLEVGGNISVRTYSGTYGSLRFGTTNASYLDAWAGIESDWESTGVNVANLKFYTSYGSRSEKMRITSQGNVGIGTTANIDSILTVNANSGNVTNSGGLTLLGANPNYGARFTVYDTGTGIQGQISLKIAGSYNTPSIVIGGNAGGASVGIAKTSAPNATLDVNGNAIITGSLTSNGDIYANGTNGVVLYNADPTNYNISRSGGDLIFKGSAIVTVRAGGTGANNAEITYSNLPALYFKTANSTRMTIDANGNVGIGITSPLYNLHVSGSIYSVMGGTDGGQIRLANSGGGSTWYWAARTTGLNLGELTQADGRLFIQNGGNVGIGTGSPNALLTVNSAGSEVRFRLNTNGTNQIIVNHDSSVGILRTESNTPLAFGTYGSERMRIAADGNVGIGTTSPILKLDVSGSVHIAGGVEGIRLANVGDNSAYDNVKLYYTGYNSGAPRLFITPRTQPGSGNVNTYLHLSSSAANPGQNTMGLLVDGSVGIGVLSPNAKLHITGSAIIDTVGGNSSLTISNSNPSGYSVLNLKNTGGTAQSYHLSVGGSAVGGLAQSFYIYDETNNATRFYVKSDGNIGIGTTTPSYKLDVNGSINTNTGMYIQYPYGDAYPLVLTGTSFLKANANYYGMLIKTGDVNYLSGGIRIVGGASPRLEVQAYEETVGPRNVVIPYGNFGIGTNSPTQLLHVSGSVRINGGIYDSSNSIGTNGQVLTSTGTGLSWSSAGSGTISGTGTANYVARFSAATNITTGSLYDNGSSVGIGTTTPAYKLDVSGSIASDTGLMGQVSAYGSGFVQFSHRSRAGTDQYSFLSGNAGDTYISSANGYPIYFRYENSARMILTSAGNLGIGTTSPADLLNIQGTNKNIRVTNTAAYNASGTAYLGFNGYYNSSNADSWFARIVSGKENTTDGDVRGYLSIQTNNPSSGIADRVRIDSNGSVGIGTSSPSQLVEASKSQDGDTAIQVTNSSTGTAATAQFFASNGTTRTQFYHTGTSYGTVGAITANQGGIYNGTSAGLAIVATNASSVIKFATGGTTEKMRLDANGNLGIGTTSPSALLHTVNTVDIAGPLFENTGGRASITIKASSTNSGYVQFGNANGNSRAFIDFRESTGYFSMSTSFSGGYITFNTDTQVERVRITSTGNVGIGNTTPLYKLDVSGSVRTGDTTLYSAAGTNPKMFFSSSVGSSSIRLEVVPDGGLSFIGSNGQLFGISDSLSGSLMNVSDISGLPIFEVSSDDKVVMGKYGTNALVVTGSSVGIGTSTPKSKLHITGSTAGDGGSFSGDGSIVYIRQHTGWSGNQPWALFVEGYSYLNGFRINANDGIRALYKTASGGQLGFAVAGNDPITFTQNDSSERMRIAAGGSVGIGTSAPLNKFVISNAGAGGIEFNSGLTFGGFSNVGYIASYDRSAGAFRDLVIEMDSSNYFAFKANGSIGIGKVTPNAKLDVNGNTIITGSLTSSLDCNINGLTVGTGKLNVTTNTAVGISALASVTDSYLASYNTAVGRTALTANTTGGSNTAIGFNTLYTNSVGSYNIALGASAIFSNTSGSYNIAIGASGLYDVTTGTYNTALGYNTGRGITTGNYNTIIGAQVTGLSSALSNTIIIADGQGNQRIYVNSSGNVGIGTTTPTAKLDVNGNAFISGSLKVSAYNNVGIGTNVVNWPLTVAAPGNTGMAIVTTDLALGSAGTIFYLGLGASTGTTYGSLEVTDALVPANRQNIIIQPTSAARVGIGKTTPNAKLDVLGDVIITGSLTVTAPITASTLTVTNLNVSTVSSSVVYSSGSNVFGNSTSNKQQFTGSVQINGTLTTNDAVETTDVFGLKSFTKSLTVTTSWSDTGISGTDLATGTYIIQVLVDNYDVSGGQYTEYYSGTMSWYSGGTNSTDYDEIVLHKAGHAPNGNWINLRTLRQTGSNPLKLQIIANGNTSGADNYIFKFRRMI